MKIKPFESILSNYKAVFFDSYGVLKNYNGLIKGGEETIKYLEEKGIQWLVLTNDASRSPIQLADKLRVAGLKAISSEKMISSGMMAREFLRSKVRVGKVAYLGTEASAHYIEAAGLETIPVRYINSNNIEEINALVLLDDEGFDWFRDINKAINLLLKRNIPTIIANTDKKYPVSREEVAIAIGGVANLIETVVRKRFIRFGKPDSQMFMYAFQQLRNQNEIAKHEILMVGDTLQTDIMGGNKFGIDTALVLTGNTLKERAKNDIKSYGIIPNYICESIAI
ncbi:MAG: HAD-IIA family hydrolase [Bacteroidetes bacterium]|nr:HAD-IIA family hydrolase [Bacteroidota bacterium]MDF1867931.1 HAD-IIA family hydrolase [Saprospiraceae bacterium]